VPEALLSASYLEAVVSLIKDRASFVREFWDLGSYFFEAPKTFDEKAVRKQWKPDTPGRMEELASLLEATGPFDAEHMEGVVKKWIEEESLGFGQVMPPLRLSLVGALKGPHLFAIMELLGKEETISRIRYAISRIEPV
jgi:glutamyl-tRNA synthetase